MTEFGVQDNLATRNGIRIVLRFELTFEVGPVDVTVDVTVGVGNLNGATGDIGTEKNVRVLGLVEFVELMPADKVPVTEVVVHDELTATATANFPDKAGNAHVVGGVVHRRQRSYGLRGKFGTFVQEVECSVEGGVGQCAEFGFGFGVFKQNYRVPVDGSADDVAYCTAVIELVGNVVIFADTVTC